ncbi:MAG: tetratricopeptide repeat protein, partial [Myxococcota bacterium]
RRAAGDREGEIALYQELLELQPDHYGTLVSLAEAQVAQEEIEAAADTFSQILEKYPDDSQSVRRRAVLLYSLGRTEDARAGLEGALAGSPGDVELIFALGQVREGLEDGDGAIEAFEEIPEDAESYADARLHIAAILEQQGDYPAALAEVERIRAIRPNRALRFHAAVLRARTGDLEGGVALLEEILEADPTDHEALYQMGVLYGSSPALQTDRALEYMQKVLEHDPDHPQALNYIGYSWAERGERLDEAEAMILRALEHRPSDGYIIDSLGWVYFMRARPLLQNGRRDDANEYLERARQKLYRAAELTGGDPVVSEHLGDVHLMLEDKPRALEFYREAVSLEHRAGEQPDLLEKLEGLRQELEGP